MKYTNTSEGPRGLNTTEGLVIVEPGQTVDAELSVAEAKVVEKTGWFGTGAKAAAEAKTPEQVQAEADAAAAEEAKRQAILAGEAAKRQAEADAKAKK